MTGLIGAFDAYKKSEEKRLDSLHPDKFSNLIKSVQSFMNSWPNQETGTDILRASGMYNVCPREFVLNYWMPQSNKSFKWDALIKMAIGTSLHHILQNHVLGPMGVLWGDWVCFNRDSKNTKTVLKDQFHPDPVQAIYEIASQRELTYIYKEPTVFDVQHRISGHLDGFLDLSRVKFWFDNSLKYKKDILGLIKEMSSLPKGKKVILEIKTLSRRGWEGTNSASDIADYYKMQASIYQHLSGVHDTLFWLIDRDEMASKTFLYNHEPKWWNDAKNKAKLIWESIRDEKLPEAFMACALPTSERAKKCVHSTPCWGKVDFPVFVARAKRLAERSDRKFLDLSKMSFD